MNQTAALPSESLLQKVQRDFRLPNKIRRAEAINIGNINNTYTLTCSSREQAPDYILQRINPHVFHDPEAIMENIRLITFHIEAKPQKNSILPHFHTASTGKNYILDEDGSFWRLADFIPSSPPKVHIELLALERMGSAFGRFQRDLNDFDASCLTETIPGFHNTPLRLATLFLHAEEDICGRVKEVTEELAYLRSQQLFAGKLAAMQQAGELPVRVTHNDAKRNNVLFHPESGLPRAIIDLDTVMPGLAAYDFADAVRSAAACGSEEDGLHLDLEKFTALSKGFLRETANFLTPLEKETLYFAPAIITLELAARFLDDYLTGDRYFKIQFPAHNLQRAKSRLVLARDMLQKQEQMAAILTNLLK